MRNVLSGEIGKYHQMRASHLTSQILYGLSPNPYHKQKEQARKTKNLVCLLFFSVSEVFAVAKVKLCDTQ